jgi:hypothetical protein
MLIENWKKSWKLLSVKYAAVVALLPELIYRVADVTTQFMPLLSEEVKDYLPGPVRAAFALTSAGFIFFRLWKQQDKTNGAGVP